MKHFPEIKTENYRLRQFTPDDLEMVYSGLSHPEVIKYYGICFDSVEATKEQLAWYEQIFNDGTGIWWAICENHSGNPIGAIGFNDWIAKFKRAELGFWLLPDYWQRGILTAILPEVCQFAFNKMNLHRIHAEVETENIASQKTLLKTGFVYEGTMRDCEFKDGKAISLEIYSKLESDR